MLPTTIDTFAVWLMTASAAGVIVSLLYERATFFQNLSPNVKRWAIFLTFIFLPLIGVVLQIATGMPFVSPVTWQGWVTLVGNMLLQGVAAWSASQFAHGVDPQRQ